jgi:hypothetical protein
VIRSGDIDVVLSTLLYETRDVTAKANADYVPTAGLLSFGPNDSVKTFKVPLIDDVAYEGDDKKFGTRDDKVVQLRGVVYSAATETITLSARNGKLSLAKPLRLSVSGSPDGVLDLTGRPIDGDRDGRAGGDSISLVTKNGVK